MNATPVRAAHALDLSRITFGYGRRRLFEEFDLQVGERELFGVIGPNGAGKTTLLNLAAGLLSPDAGTVRLGGRDVAGLGAREIARSVAVVPQESHFAFDFTVREVVMMGRNPYVPRFGRPRQTDRDVVDRALESTEVADLARRGINQISGGERQRVVLARALAQQPAVLLLDEPTLHLDVGHQHSFVRLLAGLNARGLTVVLLTHDLNLAALLCQRVLLLDTGRKVACDVPGAVITSELIRRSYGVEPIVTLHPETGRPQVMMPARSGSSS